MKMYVFANDSTNKCNNHFYARMREIQIFKCSICAKQSHTLNKIMSKQAHISPLLMAC